MEHRLDARLLQLSAASIHALGLKLCAIDESKGWWSREAAPISLAENARQIAKESLAALTRVEAFGPEADRAHAYRIPRGFPSAARAGYAETLEAVLCNYTRMEFAEALLLQLHGRLLAHSPESRRSVGQYRTLVEPAPSAGRGRRDVLAPASQMAAHLVAGEIRSVAEWTRTTIANATFHPLLTIASFLFELLAIQPFEQGNGRLVRIMAHLLLLRSGYEQVGRASLDAVVVDHWSDCRVALHRSQASRKLLRPDLAPWLNACCDVVLAHAARARAAAEQSPDESKLSANQLGVLRLLDRNREITNRAIREGLGLPRDTAKQVIRRLVALGRIESFGAGRAVRYRRTLQRRD